MEQYVSVDALLDALKIQIGYFEEVYTLDGKKYIKPSSINFNSMGQDKFSKFYGVCKTILANTLECTEYELEKQIGEYL